jgi:hypothetical protein
MFTGAEGDLQDYSCGGPLKNQVEVENGNLVLFIKYLAILGKYVYLNLDPNKVKEAFYRLVFRFQCQFRYN